MREVDLFQPYPEPKEPRVVGPNHRTIQNRIDASYRDKEFYDGDRRSGYGGMVDDGRWGPVAETIINTYHLNTSRVLQVNAHKGFLLHELFKRGMRVRGSEISRYAASQSTIRLDIAPFTKLPYSDYSFDFVIAASCVYTLNLPDAIQCLREIQRVSIEHAWVTLAAMEDAEDVEGLLLLRQWFVLGTAILTKADWLAVMRHAGYTGDYCFHTAKHLNLVRG